MKYLIIILGCIPTFHFGQIIDIGSGFTIVRCANGDVYTCGDNQYGQLGSGAVGGNIFYFKSTASLDSVIAVSGGGGHTLSVKSDGSLFSWGLNDAAQLGNGSISNESIPTLVDSIDPVVQVSAGFYHSLVLTSDSSVWAFGDNSFGALGFPPPPYIAFRPKKIDTLKNVAKVSAGVDHSTALTRAGELWVWGQNQWGQLGIGSLNSMHKPQMIRNLKLVDVEADRYTTYGIDTSGFVWAWGRNKNGELGVANNGNRYQNVPVQIPGISNAMAIAVGYGFALVLLQNGKVMAWGKNNFHQLGDSTTVNRYSPGLVKNLDRIKIIAANDAVAFAIDSSGQIYSWGGSSSGSLASGMDTLKPVPTPVPFSDCNPLISLAESAAKTLPRTEFYPNPTGGNVYWESSTPIEEAVLLDLTGLPLKHFNRPTVLDITGVPKGMYLLKVKTGDDWVVRKIWKQ